MKIILSKKEQRIKRKSNQLKRYKGSQFKTKHQNHHNIDKKLKPIDQKVELMRVFILRVSKRKIEKQVVSSNARKKYLQKMIERDWLMMWKNRKIKWRISIMRKLLEWQINHQKIHNMSQLLHRSQNYWNNFCWILKMKS